MKTMTTTAALIAGALVVTAAVLARQPGDDESRTIKVKARGETVAELRVLKHARLQISGPKLTTRRSESGERTTITGSNGVSLRLTLARDTDISIRAEELEVTGPIAKTDFK